MTGNARPDENLERLGIILDRLQHPPDEHDHHGPNPCPVCGGVNPTPRKGQRSRKYLQAVA